MRDLPRSLIIARLENAGVQYGENMSIKSDFALGAGGALVLGVVAYMIWTKAKKTGAFDPTNPENIAYAGVNAMGAKLTNNPHFNLGASMFEWFNPGRVAAEHAAIYGAPMPEIVVNPLPQPDGSEFWDARDWALYNAEQERAAQPYRMNTAANPWGRRP